MIDKADLERIAAEVERKLAEGSCADWAASHDLADEVAKAVIASGASTAANALGLEPDEVDPEKASNLLQVLIGVFALAFELGADGGRRTSVEDMPDPENVLDFNPEDRGGLH